MLEQHCGPVLRAVLASGRKGAVATYNYKAEYSAQTAWAALVGGNRATDSMLQGVQGLHIGAACKGLGKHLGRHCTMPAIIAQMLLYCKKAADAYGYNTALLLLPPSLLLRHLRCSDAESSSSSSDDGDGSSSGCMQLHTAF